MFLFNFLIAYKPVTGKKCKDLLKILVMLSKITYLLPFCFPVLVQSDSKCCISNHNPAVTTAVMCFIFDDSDRCPKIALDPCQPFQLHYTIN